MAEGWERVGASLIERGEEGQALPLKMCLASRLIELITLLPLEEERWLTGLNTWEAGESA